MDAELLGLGNADTPEMARRLAKASPWVITVNFGDTIASGNNSSKNARNDNDGTFLIGHQDFTAYIVGASGSAIAYTPFSAAPDPTKNNNTWAHFSGLRLELYTNGIAWFDGPVRADLLFRQGRTAKDPVMWRRIPPGGNITAKLYNDSAESIQGQIMFDGLKVPN